MDEQRLLLDAFVFLAAAVIAVPIASRLGLGAVIGYLIAGAAIGPWGLKLIVDADSIMQFAQFGVVMLLFLIGLELNPKRLWRMRRPIAGLGGGQILLTTAAIAGAAMAFGLEWKLALVIGMALTLSSTAVALQIMIEKGLLSTPAGNSGFSVLLSQDIAVIPMLALLPMLAVSGGGEGGFSLLGLAEAVGVVALLVLGGRYLLRPVFRMIAATRLREVFTAVSLLVVLGAALLMDLVGMSMALGTFLAGVLLAESEYRHAIESDIEPFKGLLLGLFFISVGMAVDFGLLFAHPLLVLGLVVGVVGIKIAVLALVGRQARLPRGQTLLFAILPSQGSEFAFVLFAMAAAGGLMAAQMQSLLILVVALSLVTTPLLLIAYERVIAPRLVDQAAAGEQSVEDEQSPVLIAGFGRFGQIIGRLLNANGIATTVLDHDPQHIETIRRFGFKVFYGDAARLDLLHAAGAARAKVLVVAVDDRESALKIVELARQHFPNLTLLTRAWDVVHAFELMERNVNCVEREAFEGALKVGEEALRRLGLSAWQAKQATHRFRAHDEELLSELFSHFKEDVSVRAAISASARERLREQMEADEAEFGDGRDTDWR